MNGTITAIVLAAGGSSRLGRPKQLIAWKGMTLIEYMLDQLTDERIGQIIVVLGAYASDIEPVVRGRDIHIVINEEWKEGLGKSIAKGIEVSDTSTLGFLLCTVDQPMLSSHHVSRLLDQFFKSSITPTASIYREAHGIPAVFPKTFQNRLQSLSDDKGARDILRSTEIEINSVPFEHGDLDIDTEADIIRAQQLLGLD